VCDYHHHALEQLYMKNKWLNGKTHHAFSCGATQSTDDDDE
jgi:hypothetical protein